MWPFSLLRERKYQREYDAALVVLLGAHLFERMGRDERSRVDHEVEKLLAGSTLPPAGHPAADSPDVRAGYRAIAMAKLGIAPPLDGCTWEKLTRHWRTLPADLLFDFHRFGIPTWDAEAHLRRLGLEVPDELCNDSEVV